jgi:hypothetical protein
MRNNRWRVLIFFGAIVWFWLSGGFITGEFNPALWSETGRFVFAVGFPLFAAVVATVPVDLDTRP